MASAQATLAVTGPEGMSRVWKLSHQGNGVATLLAVDDTRLVAYPPRRVLDREHVAALRCQGLSLRHTAKKLGVGPGTVTRTLQQRSKTS
jgi:hypothetical protein